jgi:hypothetical protein
MELEIPELEQVDAVLRPGGDITRGGATPVEVDGRLSLGEPVALAMTPEFASGDEVLRAFVEAEADVSRYWLVHLACTFVAGGNEPLYKAWLAVELASADRAASSAPIAWSMTPMRLARPSQSSRTLKLGTDAKFAQASVEAGRTTETSLVYLEALHLRESTPTWEFSRTSADEIHGTMLMALVVRAPASVAVDANVQLTAVVRSRRFGVVPFRAELRDRPRLAFRLTPA